ncbi:endosome/lysosome-associated apoptosis and autophagy regulator family member 2-like isoform X2 [Ruditapes philippinarum]|uniref:endosome/lysosome-associated apoptosis and autophagy regulator family member 2-like isoform X2 n=1 Tax=Ruditapes philippinarum TaxID=129788 RepID=UPI00295AAF49|nr:endosome/lysosome-associated apoptosis and autophagy regulator family member 2-like isoform X2 [Ruditapes philippinarum]
MNWIQFELLFVCAIASVLLCSAADCGDDDYKFQFTQCDANSERWRVSVPKKDCTPTSSGYDLPVKGTSCNQECSAGEFLDMDKLKCKPCPSGKYSSGNVAHFDDWSELPKGFSVTTESFQGFGDGGDEIVDCSKYEWTPKGSYIAVLPGDCAANLIYSTTLLKAGTLTFQYQFPSATTIFHIVVQNDQCQASSDKDSSRWPDSTNEGEWQTITLNLKSGFNVITWRVIGIGSTDDTSPLLIRKMTVTGVAYTSECSKCPAGTYSSERATICTLCPANKYSLEGAMSCSDCDVNKYYSTPGSVNCTERPPCTESDYYHILKPCDENGKTGMIYRWVQPVICDPNHLSSAKLPDSSEPIDCHTCNPGMHLVNKTCTYCSPGFMSNGVECKECPATTAPDYGYELQNWNDIPNVIETTCVSFSEENCNNDTKWLPYGDHIQTHFARGESAYLVLQIKVKGFRTQQKAGEGGTSTVGQLSVVFETDCKGFCQFVILSDENGKQDLIQSWENAQARNKFTYDIKRNGSFEFTLAFQNSGWLIDSTTVAAATAKIYSIQITNTMGGGASNCRKCPKGTNDDGCVPCPDGSYIDPATTTCVNCPPGTVVTSHNAYGADSCKPCGHGLAVYRGTSCFSDGQYTDDNGRMFDFRNLSNSFKFIQGSLLFTSSGTQYYHGFNISLFGTPDKSQVICENNVTRSDSHISTHAGKPDFSVALHEPSQIVARVCRTTLVPSSDKSSTVMTTQSTSLGDRLVEILRNQTSLTMTNGTKSLDELYNASGFDITEINNDIQVHFAAETPTRACPTGRHTLVSLRCDEDQKGQGEITLPPKCADGTCDGCMFHFMWNTRLACPICQKEDFHRVVGECLQGTQTIHYFPPSHCLAPENMKKIEETQKCTVRLASLPLIVQVAVPVVVGLALLFFLLVCFFWRKNKKLEYRYMKLVENSSGAEEELPGVDSCALEEGEDELGDSVQIRSSKGARFFKKLTNKIKKDDAFESAVLNERMPLT